MPTQRHAIRRSTSRSPPRRRRDPRDGRSGRSLSDAGLQGFPRRRLRAASQRSRCRALNGRRATPCGGAGAAAAHDCEPHRAPPLRVRAARAAAAGGLSGAAELEQAPRSTTRSRGRAEGAAGRPPIERRLRRVARARRRSRRAAVLRGSDAASSRGDGRCVVGRRATGSATRSRRLASACARAPTEPAPREQPRRPRAARSPTASQPSRRRPQPPAAHRRGRGAAGRALRGRIPPIRRASASSARRSGAPRRVLAGPGPAARACGARRRRNPRAQARP